MTTNFKRTFFPNANDELYYFNRYFKKVYLEKIVLYIKRNGISRDIVYW